MAQVVAGDVPCNVCRGELKTKYRISGTDRLADRVCESCYGSGFEKCSPELRLKSAAELAHYIEPVLKAIEHTGADGGAIQHKHEIVFVE